MLKVYCAAPFATREEVHALHSRLRDLRIDPVARWPYTHHATDAGLTVAEARRQLADNDRGLDAAHALLVCAREDAGRETYCEAARAVCAGLPIVWTGPRALSSYRRGVLWVPTLDEAVAVLVGWRDLVARAWPVETEWARAVIRSVLLEAEDELAAVAHADTQPPEAA